MSKIEKIYLSFGVISAMLTILLAILWAVEQTPPINYHTPAIDFMLLLTVICFLGFVISD